MAAKAIYKRVVQDQEGNLVPSVEFTVIDEASGLGLTIYSDRLGATTLTPPYFADVDGRIEFFVDPGTTFRVSGTGPTGSFTDRWVDGVLLGDDSGNVPTITLLGTAALTNTGSLPAEIPTNAIADQLRMKYINSQADFDGYIGVVDGQQVSMRGFHPDSDVGGGMWYWKSDEPKANHKGGTVRSPTVPFVGATLADFLVGVGETDPSGTGCWVRLIGRSIMASFFGAIGGSGTDQHAPLSAWANTSGSIHTLDDGDYSINTELIINISNTVFEGTRKAVIIPVETRGIQINGQSDVVISGITVAYPDATVGSFSSILLLNCDRCSVDGVEVLRTTSVTEAIKAKDCNDCKITNNDIIDSKGAGIFLQGTLLGRGKRNLVHGNRIDGTGFAGIYSRKNDSDTNTNNVVSSNMLTGVGRNTDVSLCVGIEMWGDSDIVESNTVSGHTISGNPSPQSIIGITIGKSTKSTVIGNVVRFFSIYGIEVGNLSHDTTVTANTVTDIYDDALTPSSGVGYSSTGTFDSDDLVYSSNVAIDCYDGFKADFGTRIKLIGNNFTGKFDRAVNDTRGVSLTSNVTFAEITSNTFRNFNIGVLPADNAVTSESVRIDGNFFDGCAWGVRSLNKSVNITSNTFNNCGVSGSSAAIGLESGGEWCVQNNRFNHSTPTVAAIVLKNESTDHGGIITGNVIGSGVVLTAAVTSWVQVNVKDTNYTNTVKATYGSAIPGSGTFSAGDIIYNTSPTAGGKIGFVCIASGTPGTWKAFGAIDA